MTGTIEIFVGMLLAVAALALLARRLHIPYPILFVVGGLLLGLIPGVPRVQLDPQLVFLFFLPPLLFPAALYTSWRDFRANLRPISLLAIGLVLITTVAIAWLAHLFMGLPLAAGFVLGAIVSPPDAIARHRHCTNSLAGASTNRHDSGRREPSSTTQPHSLLTVSALRRS